MVLGVCRAALRHRHDAEDAARRLQCTPATVKGRVQRGRELLRCRLERRGLGLSAALGAAMLTNTSSAAAIPLALATATLRVVASGASPAPVVDTLARGM